MSEENHQTEKEMDMNGSSHRLTQEEMASLGAGAIGYMRKVSSEEARLLLPLVKGIPDNQYYIGIFDADGDILAITDTRDAAAGYLRQKKRNVHWVH